MASGIKFNSKRINTLPFYRLMRLIGIKNFQKMRDSKVTVKTD